MNLHVWTAQSSEQLLGAVLIGLVVSVVLTFSVRMIIKDRRSKVCAKRTEEARHFQVGRERIVDFGLLSEDIKSLVVIQKDVVRYLTEGMLDARNREFTTRGRLEIRGYCEGLGLVAVIDCWDTTLHAQAPCFIHVDARVDVVHKLVYLRKNRGCAKEVGVEGLDDLKLLEFLADCQALILGWENTELFRVHRRDSRRAQALLG
jgi:hypothetical protein